MRRIARTLHAWLGRWLTEDQPADSPPPTECEPPETMPVRILVSQFPITRDLDEEREADAWYRAHFKINGVPWDGRR